MRRSGPPPVLDGRNYGHKLLRCKKSALRSGCAWILCTAMAVCRLGHLKSQIPLRGFRSRKRSARDRLKHGWVYRWFAEEIRVDPIPPPPVLWHDKQDFAFAVLAEFPHFLKLMRCQLPIPSRGVSQPDQPILANPTHQGKVILPSVPKMRNHLARAGTLNPRNWAGLL